MSLSLLKTDYIDIYQFHNLPFCPKPNDGTGLYEAMLEAKKMGLIRHIGITSHKLAIAEEAIKSGLYETLQFPFSYLASEKEEALVKLCEENDVSALRWRRWASLKYRLDGAMKSLVDKPLAGSHFQSKRKADWGSSMWRIRKSNSNRCLPSIGSPRMPSRL